ncbi:MAG: acetyl-CoA carboxylase biotin carboxyl carrier protein [Clostridia bacterium]|nr:acetyl-CoA carboxylase biotin carboxyl carrier protein [Clostridia bacterium]
MDYNEIKKLITDIGESKVDEVNLEFPDGIKISVKKNNQIIKEIIKQNPNEILENKEQTIETKQTTTNENYQIVKSPMVGTFYLKPSPTEKPYVEIGQTIKKGETLCIIEAMKLMNEIESEYAGEIVEILVKDGETVEYGTELFKIK